MSDLAEFLRMGGHGPYVWGSWILAALTLAVNLLFARNDKRQALKDAREDRNNRPDGENRAAEKTPTDDE